jgi:hypothetical protein
MTRSLVQAVTSYRDEIFVSIAVQELGQTVCALEGVFNCLVYWDSRAANLLIAGLRCNYWAVPEHDGPT